MLKKDEFQTAFWITFAQVNKLKHPIYVKSVSRRNRSFHGPRSR
jgi:hypothetical protein